MENNDVGTLSGGDLDDLFGGGSNQTANSGETSSPSGSDKDGSSLFDDMQGDLDLSSLVSSELDFSEAGTQEFNVRKTLAHDILLEASLDVIVELGRLDMYIKDILRLNEGTIIELGKSIHEPVNILLNNRFIGKGEVVVSDEDFGVRVLELFLDGGKK